MEWRDIPDYESLYEISEYGDVHSVSRTFSITSRWGGTIHLPCGGLAITPEINDRGYRRYKLYKDGRYRRFFLQQLLALAFVGPQPEPHYQACHSDGDNQNNHYSNIRWDTPAGNVQDRLKHGRDHNASKTHCPQMHLLEPPNLRASALRNGNRSCLACSRARAYANTPGRRHLGMDWAPMSDEYYVRIMDGIPDSDAISFAPYDGEPIERCPFPRRG